MAIKIPDLLFLDTTSVERDMILVALHGKKPSKGFKDLTQEQLAELQIAEGQEASVAYWSRPPIEDLTKLEEGLEQLSTHVKILSVSKSEFREISKINLDMVDNVVTKPFRMTDVGISLKKGLEIFKKKSALIELKKALQSAIDQDDKDLANTTIASFPEEQQKNAMFAQIVGEYYAKMDDAENAFTYFRKGLARNKYHKGCMTGLFNLLYKHKQWENAIFLARVMLGNTLVDKETFLLILRVSILEQGLELFQMMLKYFSTYYQSNKEVKRQVGYATFIILKNRFADISDEDFEKDVFKVSFSDQQGPDLLLELTELLYNHDLTDKVNATLKAFPKSAMEKPQYRKAYFYKIIKRVSEPVMITKKAEELLKEGYDSKTFTNALRRYYYFYRKKQNLTELYDILYHRGVITRAPEDEED